ncbi:hypothetical protein MMC29_003277 [Sticta canariensis]|nr:hypothetical protein [Sticta canariensis]
MSGAIYWLQKQRKAELAGLADHVGLKNYENLLKPDLELKLEEYLRVNQNKLINDPSLEPFFKRIAASPVRRENIIAITPGDEFRKPRVRRQTKAPEEIEPPLSDPEPLNTRTPQTALSLSHSIPFPPSPAALADRIETQTTSLSNSVIGYVSSTWVPSALRSVRANLSSVIGIELLALFIEAWGLRSQVLPLRYLTTLPAAPALGTGELAIKIPDLFTMLTVGFWGPVGLWALTSVLLPLVGAWFINLTDGARSYDPVSFNVVKALVAWVVYVRSGVGGESRVVVERGVPGGAQGLLIGAGIGVLASLYEAVLRN